MKSIIAFSALLALVAAAPLPQDSYSSGADAGAAAGSATGSDASAPSASYPEGAAAPTGATPAAPTADATAPYPTSGSGSTDSGSAAPSGGLTGGMGGSAGGSGMGGLGGLGGIFGGGGSSSGSGVPEVITGWAVSLEAAQVHRLAVVSVVCSAALEKALLSLLSLASAARADLRAQLLARLPPHRRLPARALAARLPALTHRALATDLERKPLPLLLQLAIPANHRPQQHPRLALRAQLEATQASPILQPQQHQRLAPRPQVEVRLNLQPPAQAKLPALLTAALAKAREKRLLLLLLPMVLLIPALRLLPPLPSLERLELIHLTAPTALRTALPLLLLPLTSKCSQPSEHVSPQSR
jgi:hypothetical protein